MRNREQQLQHEKERLIKYQNYMLCETTENLETNNGKIVGVRTEINSNPLLIKMSLWLRAFVHAVFSIHISDGSRVLHHR